MTTANTTSTTANTTSTTANTTSTTANTTATPEFPLASIVAYPRIGRHRELKKAVEAYWAGKISQAELVQSADELKLATYARLVELGLGKDDSSIPASFSYYDQVLDTAFALGAVPRRFQDLFEGDQLGLDAYFTLARGDQERPPLEMTKWFDTNYHYLVPEISEDTEFHIASTELVEDVRKAAAGGYTVRPALVGPVTFLLLSKAAEDAGDGFTQLSRLDDVLAVYQDLLREFAGAGAKWVQLDESALVADHDVDPAELASLIEHAYEVLSGTAGRPAIAVVSAYGDLRENFAPLAKTGIEALHIDVFKGAVPQREDLALLGETALVAGVVDGHNIWANDLRKSIAVLNELREGVSRVTVSTSTSLQHVPHTLEDESQLGEKLLSWLAFADEKVREVVTLAGYLKDEDSIAPALEVNDKAKASRAADPGVNRSAVRERTAGLGAEDFVRGDFEGRRRAQAAALDLPVLPTTTIGSFPQTAQVRSARAALNKGTLDEQEYQKLMRSEIERVIGLQEELGFDVLVHGEPERNDMVQYFAENLDGFAVSANGWVQSYGSRCTRPSILWGDVSRPGAITVPWSQYAQSLTAKPVKGMLTGPVTILAWSFVRDDQPLEQTANQVALALRDEIADLETAGIKVIQVDEPALRELLPLRKSEQEDYLKWSVDAFRLATADADDATQVHTHLCYSEFGEVIGAIDALDADVTSIEAARSRMEVVNDLAEHGFGRGVGPGVYDIHSPRVPSEAEITELLTTALEYVSAGQLWVNPDCGLKTRGYQETEESLRHLVGAAKKAREAAEVPQAK